MESTQHNMITYGSNAHVVALFAKMKNAPITEHDMRAISPKRFSRLFRIRETLNSLEKKNIVSRSSSGWMITPTGKRVLLAVAQEHAIKTAETMHQNLSGGSKGVKTLKKKTND